MPREYRPPSAKSISTFLYVVVIILALAIAYVAVRALLA
jgi:hypothetical protein